MKSALTYNTKTIKKVKVESADGENSQAAKEDRLRISSFQAFWKTTLQNVYLLNYLKEPKVDHSHEIHRLIDNKKVCGPLVNSINLSCVILCCG